MSPAWIWALAMQRRTESSEAASLDPFNDLYNVVGHLREILTKHNVRVTTELIEDLRDYIDEYMREVRLDER